MRYERQRSIEAYQHLDEILGEQRLGIVGAGGLGGLCAYLLLGAGAIKLTIADCDRVDVSNLHRQVLYSEADLGKSKVLCAKTRLLSLNHQAQITAFEERINAANFKDFAKDCRLILDLSDNVETRLLINRLCLENRLDYVHASVGAHQALMAYFKFSDEDFIRKYGCYECLCGNDAAPLKKGIPGPFAATVSAFAANLVMQSFTNELQDKLGFLYLFDLKDFSIKKLKLSRSLKCSCCSHGE